MNVKDGVLKDEQSLVVTTVVFQLSFVLNYSIGWSAEHVSTWHFYQTTQI